MAFRTSTNSSQTFQINQNPFLSALAYPYLGGYEKWSSTTLTYTLNKNDANPDGEQIATWTNSLTNAIEQAHDDLEAISNLRFVEVADTRYGTDFADIDYWYYRNFSDGFLGYSYGVDGSGVYINESFVYEPGFGQADGLTYGGYNYETVIHELLHNLGLGHPHPETGAPAAIPGVTSAFDDTGNFALNQTLYTVMSYNSIDQVDFQGAPTTGQPFFSTSTVDRGYSVMGALDVAIVQALYGANLSTATGNDVYQIASSNQSGTHFKAIWDAGGTDEFQFNGFGRVTIDLRAATLNTADGALAGGMLSRADGVNGGFTIARGTVIENATGGSGSDKLTGNEVDNVLTGALGSDSVDGMAGDDLIIGGTQASAVAEGINLSDPNQRPDDVGFYLDPYDGAEPILARQATQGQLPTAPSGSSWWDFNEFDGLDLGNWPILA